MAIKWALKTALGLVVLGVCLFGVAGRLDWPAAWGLTAIAAINQVVVYALVSRVHLDLLEERGRIQPGTKNWDRTLAPLMAYSGLYICITCALDQRFLWSGSFPGWLQWAALLPILAGLVLGQWAMVTNRFFSSTVRIQTERGHHVVEDGPYRYIRHPGYISAILYNLATPLLLGSWWGLFPGVFAVGVAILRTLLEERTLQAELPAYAHYAQRVKYRFIPGIW